MSYHISSDRFDDPSLTELLRTLTRYFQSIGIDFYVIGAAARDIVLGGIHDRKTGRRTMDLDIAIMVADWETFEQIAAGLCGMSEFRRSDRQKQRFHFKERLVLDILPFGEIAESDKNIYWPPNGTQAMSVSGFTEMAREALSVEIAGQFTILVASVPGIFILKIFAWRDRCRQTKKDAEDIALFIDEYFEINLDRTIGEDRDIYASENFSTFIAGGILMGRDCKMMLRDNVQLLSEFAKIIESEIVKEEGSLLINQILEAHLSKKYEEVYDALAKMLEELKK